MSSLNNVNKVILVGNLGSDPELRYTGKGQAVVNLAIATSRSVKQDDGEYLDKTQWHRAVVWGKRAETCARYLKTGHRVYVEGILQTRIWTDKEEREQRSFEIMVNDIKFLSGKPASSGNNEGDTVTATAS